MLCDAVYLLSNNHINGLIAAPFNPDEEELIAYYISFLKTLSLSLNPMTVQFFFNKVRDGGGFCAGMPVHGCRFVPACLATAAEHDSQPVSALL